MLLEECKYESYVTSKGTCPGNVWWNNQIAGYITYITNNYITITSELIGSRFEELVLHCRHSSGERSLKWMHRLGDRSLNCRHSLEDRSSVNCRHSSGEKSLNCRQSSGDRSVNCRNTSGDGSLYCFRQMKLYKHGFCYFTRQTGSGSSFSRQTHLPKWQISAHLNLFIHTCTLVSTHARTHKQTHAHTHTYSRRHMHALKQGNYISFAKMAK